MASVDIILTGVTGFVGRHVYYELLERYPNKSIAVVIRSSGKKSANQRFHEEIENSSLFSQKVFAARVIDAAIETIETTTHHITSATTLIHCAANVKHYDPYTSLERDNVENVERIVRLAESLQVKTLLLLSTCYVHPRGVQERLPQRIPTTYKQSDFYNDYCYTKWRGEEAVFAAKSSIPNIQILRLSCVGAPSRWELAAHPCAAQAHLGILSLALRGFLETLAWRPTSRISTIPVDIVAKAIVDRMESAEAGVQIEQICAPPSLHAYHIPLPQLMAMLQSEFGLEDFRGLARSDPRGLHLTWWKQVVYSFLTRGKQALTLHSHVQDFVSTFTDEDIRFTSSLSEADFPQMSETDIARATCEYAVRILHHRQLAKGVPVSRIDQFWHRVANREPVQACLHLDVGVEEWPAMQERLWTFFLSHRKCSAGLSNASPLDGPILWKQLPSHSMSSYFASFKKFNSEDAILSYGLQQPAPLRLWHITPFVSEGRVTHILLRFDHSLADGVGMLSHLPEFSRRVLQVSPSLEGIRMPRSLALWMDLWLGLVYIVLLVLMLWNAPTMDATRSNEPTVATWTGQWEGGPRTFTTNILWHLTQFFTATKRTSEHIFAVPAVTSLHRPAKDMPTNAFVPILLPVDSRMSEEAFAQRCMLLRARSVRFLSWCLVQLLEWGVWDEIRDLFLGKVRCVVSSLQMGETLPEEIKSMYVVTTTPTPIPCSLTVLTARGQMFITARSHDPSIAAADLARAGLK